jgi:hypothetical protein
MGLYGGSRVEYNPPPVQKDDSFENLLQYEQQKEKATDERLQKEKDEQKAATAARNATGAASYGGLRTTVESQLRQGLISYADATQQLRDYSSKYDMTPPEADVGSLTDIYTKELVPGRRNTAIDTAYQEIYGRPATEAEKSAENKKFSDQYYTTNEDLRNALYKSPEYTKKYNDNYLDNYFDTQFGSSVEARTEEYTDPTTGEKKTKVSKLRKFNFDPSLLPTYSDQAGLEKKTGVTQPDYAKYFGQSRSIEELQQGLQGVKDTRQYLYSAGLTNLQGEIDKETQKLKNEGSKELAKVQSQGAIYNSLVGSFNF